MVSKAVNLSSIQWLLKNMFKYETTKDYCDYMLKDIHFGDNMFCQGTLYRPYTTLEIIEYDEKLMSIDDYKRMNIPEYLYIAKLIYDKQEMHWFDMHQCKQLAKIIINSTTGFPGVDFRLKDVRRLFVMIEKSFINDIIVDILEGYSGVDYIGWILDARSIVNGTPRFPERDADNSLEDFYNLLGDGAYE
ncbi:MAG: hypothetical protein HDR03_14955 [Lachnospiraceae bacterium]|nr:hypothetical protein [Lachnospiraceae bacterium]